MLSVRDTCGLDSRSAAAVSSGFPRSAWLSQASAAGSLKRGSVLTSKRVIAQIRVPDMVSTMSPTVWSSPGLRVAGGRDRSCLARPAVSRISPVSIPLW